MTDVDPEAAACAAVLLDVESTGADDASAQSLFDKLVDPKNGYLERLACIPPLPKPAHSWPFPRALLLDGKYRDLLREIVRITRSVSIRVDERVFGSKRLAMIQSALACQPEYLALNIGPYHFGKWRKDDGDVLGADEINYAFILAKHCGEVKALVDRNMKSRGSGARSPIIVVLYDHELWAPGPAVNVKLQLVDELVRRAVGIESGQFYWYNYGQHREKPSVDAGVINDLMVFKKTGPVDFRSIDSDAVSCSLYYYPGNEENARRLRYTKAWAEVACSPDYQLIPWLSLGCYWLHLAGHHTTGGGGRCFVYDRPPSFDDTWHLAQLVFRDKHVVSVGLWPEVCDPKIRDWGKQFIVFCCGAHGKLTFD